MRCSASTWASFGDEFDPFLWLTLVWSLACRVIVYCNLGGGADVHHSRPRASRTRAPSPPSRVGTSIGSDSYLDRDVASAVSRATTGPIWQTRDKGSGVQLRCFVKLTLIVASTEPCGASIYLARLTLWHLKSSPPSLAPPSNTTKNTVITRLLAPSSLKRHGCTNGDGFGDASVAPRAASGEAREDGRLHPP